MHEIIGNHQLSPTKWSSQLQTYTHTCEGIARNLRKCKTAAAAALCRAGGVSDSHTSGGRAGESKRRTRQSSAQCHPTGAEDQALGGSQLIRSPSWSSCTDAFEWAPPCNGTCEYVCLYASVELLLVCKSSHQGCLIAHLGSLSWAGFVGRVTHVYWSASSCLASRLS